MNLLPLTKNKCCLALQTVHHHFHTCLDKEDTDAHSYQSPKSPTCYATTVLRDGTSEMLPKKQTKEDLNIYQHFFKLVECTYV